MMNEHKNQNCIYLNHVFEYILIKYYEDVFMKRVNNE